MSNTIPTQVPSARQELPRAKGDSATRRAAASGASGSPGVVINSGSPDEGGSNKASSGVTERRHEAIRDAIAKEVAKAAEQADRSGVRVRTEVHEATGRYIVKVIDGESGKVLREFPPAEYLDVMAALEELGGTLLEGKI